MTETREKCQSARQPCDAENYQNWISRLPPVIQRMIERHPPSCYRIPAITGGHFQPATYHADGTVSLKHLKDSSRAPGTVIRGVNPGFLERCDCGAVGHVQVL